MVLSYKSMLQYHNQDLDIDAVKILDSFITTWSPLLHFYKHTLLFLSPSLSDFCQSLICYPFLKFCDFKCVI